MRKLLNNQYVDMTENEIVEHENAKNDAVITPTIDDRISALENAITDLAIMITGVSTND